MVGPSLWTRLDRVMRALHLYTSMFLVPWMMVYAISGFFVNHNEWFAKNLQLQPQFQVVQEMEFDPVTPRFHRTRPSRPEPS